MQPLGWIVMAFDASKAKSLRDSFVDLQTQVANMANDRKQETDLITFVTLLIKQCTEIEQKMETAITAITELSSLFSEQVNSYDKISAELDRMSASADMKSLINRKSSIDYHLRICVEKLKDVSDSTSFSIQILLTSFQLKDVAQEFAKSIICQEKL
jgi:hypothetical protein